jgi:predicted Zn-dependent protease
LAAAGCQEVPVTGRSAVDLVDDKAVNEQAAAEFEQIKKMQRLSRNPAQIKVVQDIGRRLSQTAFWDVPHAEWEFVVFHAPGVLNAFAMPGGKVGVMSGLIDFCENESQLASVMAHEIGHVAARHSHERHSQQMLLQPLGTAASIGVSTTVSGTGVYLPGVGGAAGSGITGLTQSAWDRGKELEADHIGLIYMAKSGYDPRESLKFLRRMEEYIASQTGTQSNGWFATHPDFPERQIKLNEHMAEAVEIYERGEEERTHTVIE